MESSMSRPVLRTMEESANFSHDHQMSSWRQSFLHPQHQKQSTYGGRELLSKKLQNLEKGKQFVHRSKITSFRDYRSGDFPDIEIPYSAVIRPLQELAKVETGIACQLFVMLFKGLLEEHHGTDAYTQNIQDSLNNILRNSKDYSATLMGTIMEIGLMYNKSIALHPEYIADASAASGLLALGSLLLEEALIQKETISEPQPPKRSKMMKLSNEEDIWLRLACLYERMEEWDVVRGIFNDHLTCEENIQKAIKWEASGHWSNAKREYEVVLGSVDNEHPLNCYYHEAFYKCVAHMSNWKGLNKTVMEQVDNLEQFWSDDWHQGKLLPQLMLSEVHMMLDNGIDGDRNEFLMHLETWLVHKDRRDYMSDNFWEELAVISIFLDKIGQAQCHVKSGLMYFLKSWAELNPLFLKLRAKQLLDMQRITELEAYLRFASAVECSEQKLQGEELLRKWHKNLPHSSDSLLCWDAKAMYRRKFANHIQKSLERSIAAELIGVELAMVDSAVCQENFNVAKKYLLHSQKKLDDTDTAVRLQWNLAFSKAKLLQARLKETSHEKFKLIMCSWDTIGKLEEDSKTQEYPLLYSEILHHASAIITGILHLNLQSLTNEMIQKLAGIIGSSDCSESVLVKGLKTHGLRSLKRAVELVTCDSHVSQKQEEQYVAKAYLEVAKYCRSFINSQSDENNFDSELVKSILRAMQHGSKDARQLFPCLLQLPGLDKHLSSLFCEESVKVPIWMFLGWISQLLACLDSSIGPILYNLVRSLAQMYPQAMIYAFRLSHEKYNVTDVHFKSFVDELNGLLSQNSLVDQFLRAFSCLAQPCKMLFYFMDKMKKLIAVEKPNLDTLLKMYDTMMEELFPSLDEKFHGAIFRELNEFKTNVKLIETSIKCGKRDVSGELDKIKEKIKEKLNKHTSSTLLKDYSPWLSEFHAGKHGIAELEIPGQYTGEAKPLVQHHIRIVGFDQKVTVQVSKQSPLRISILGNDAKVHDYLVKFGEDLRQDQRLQQLFTLMNKILNQDPACKQRTLHITTYQVVPLTGHLGIIQWVTGTQSLKSLILKSLVGEEINSYKQSREEYSQWIIAANSKKKNCEFGDMYGEAYVKYTANDVHAAFQEKVNMIPWDVMRRALWKLATSPELYFSLRQNFACSHAVLCISHWLLGVGDRHLDNCLVSVINGQCLGIDFGYAFGTATQFLPVPELMPFRLTPHIINLLKPLNNAGLFRETMIHCLRALRNNHDMLLATMEVFVQEPSIDWLELASKHESTNMNSSGGTQEWYPQQKLHLVKLKLEGANPVTITTSELNAGFKNSKYLNKYLETAKGCIDNIRAKLPSHSLSPEEQVDCLLDQATDSNILGKSWVGWEPWI